MIRRFARPYAKAIMDVAGSAHAANTIRGELALFDQARRSSVELQEVFGNPGIEMDAKIAIATKIADRLKLSTPSVKVLEVLLRNHRINDMEPIVSALREFVNEATDTVVADVRSAYQLSQEETAQLRASLEKKFGRRVELQVTTDPSLLGGFVAKVGSEIYDASVAGKIDKFRDSLSEPV